MYSNASEVEAGELEAETRALREDFEAYLPDGYRVDSARFFLVRGDVGKWAPLERWLGEHLTAERHARREYFNHHRAGHDQKAVWSVNQAYTLHVGAAMNRESLPDGRILFAYFYLTSD